jgi:hypothetical protein
MADLLTDTIAGLVTNFETERAKKRQTCKVLLLIGFIALPLGIVLFLLNFMLQWDSGVATSFALLFIIAGLAVLCAAPLVKRSYTKRVGQTLSGVVNQILFPKRVELPREGLNEKLLLKPGFFAVPDRYLYSDFMSSTYEGIPFERAKYDLQREETTTDSKGHTTTTYNTYAKGTMYHFTYERDFGQIVKVLEKQGFFSLGHQGLTKVETEYILFNKKFLVLASDETTVFYLLTPQIQEKILSLEGKFRGQFYMAFIGNELFIAVNDSDTSIQVPWKEKATLENLMPVVECFAIPAVFIKLLGLNKNKFLKDAGIHVTDQPAK